MADIIEFPNERPDDDPDVSAQDDDGFLLKEGLDLLAYYRAITDADVRASIMRLVASLSRAAQQSAG